MLAETASVNFINLQVSRDCSKFETPKSQQRHVFSLVYVHVKIQRCRGRNRQPAVEAASLFGNIIGEAKDPRLSEGKQREAIALRTATRAGNTFKGWIKEARGGGYGVPTALKDFKLDCLSFSFTCTGFARRPHWNEETSRFESRFGLSSCGSTLCIFLLSFLYSFFTPVFFFFFIYTSLSHFYVCPFLLRPFRCLSPFFADAYAKNKS